MAMALTEHECKCFVSYNTLKYGADRYKMDTPIRLLKNERKKRTSAKTSLNTPYKVQWSSLQHNDIQFIWETLKRKLTATGLEKKEVKVFRRWRKKANFKTLAGLESVCEPSQISLSTTTPQLPEKRSEQGWTNVVARRQLAIGINEVTKAVEQNQLSLVLVCKSAKPVHMTSHLIALCRTRGIAACQVPRLSENVAGLLRLKCVLALGFKRGNEDDIFLDTVQAILPRVPALQVAWIPNLPLEKDPNSEGQVGEKGGTAGEGQVGEKGGTAGEGQVEKTAEGQMEVNTLKETRGQKRKLENIFPYPVLQPLRVKKIIPNPSKIRKLKTKKK
ncbi:hypothetical protein UPYG_G00156450 [Umbra pygmaea]|uniref:Ribosomal protein eL8/eL30/eS12/Gadd45 domain-containing protein n=1 Tax=Umbra pygmaea TaxID=75934 RepID=A0ABD0X2F1_UMBPY